MHEHIQQTIPQVYTEKLHTEKKMQKMTTKLCNMPHQKCRKLSCTFPLGIVVLDFEKM